MNDIDGLDIRIEVHFFKTVPGERLRALTPLYTDKIANLVAEFLYMGLLGLIDSNEFPATISTTVSPKSTSITETSNGNGNGNGNGRP